jgi:hypothetical protein
VLPSSPSKIKLFTSSQDSQESDTSYNTARDDPCLAEIETRTLTILDIDEAYSDFDQSDLDVISNSK